MGNCLWKKKKLNESKKFLEEGLKRGKTKEGLRYLSIILRSINNDISKNVKDSIEYAKEAIKLDIKDGESWYILGNALLTHYFINTLSYETLKKSWNAYNISVF